MTVTTTAQTVNVQRDEAAWHGHGAGTRAGGARTGSWCGSWKRSTTPGRGHATRRTAGSPTAPTGPRCGGTGSPWSTRAGRCTRRTWTAIIAEAMRKRRKRRAAKASSRPWALNVVYADPQAGKVALLGGTRELAARVGTASTSSPTTCVTSRSAGSPTEASWLDAGDCSRASTTSPPRSTPTTSPDPAGPGAPPVHLPRPRLPRRPVLGGGGVHVRLEPRPGPRREGPCGPAGGRLGHRGPLAGAGRATPATLTRTGTSGSATPTQWRDSLCDLSGRPPGRPGARPPVQERHRQGGPGLVGGADVRGAARRRRPGA